jgi:cytochrome c biogenesis protein CcmG/thiol:disulfide interchange protein DsbE
MRRAPVVLALVAAALAAGCGGLGGDAAADLTPPGERTVAPAFSVPALDGDGRVTLAAHRGRPVVLNFWASWCGPCREEMPELVRFAGEQPGIDVVGLAVNDRPADSRRFADRAGATFELGIDRDAVTAGEYGVTGLPVTVAIDAEGRVATTIFGPVGEEELDGLAEGLAPASADESRAPARSP